jgi:hypothetical protein
MTRPFAIDTGRGPQPVDLDQSLDGARLEQADVEANRWIKRLRHARVDGAALRDRFTHRGDSLWWFAELYLHKRRVITRAHRAIAALESLADADPRARWVVDGSDHVVGCLAHAVAVRRGVACEGPADRAPARGAGTRAKALFHTATAMADRLRPTPPPAIRRGVAVAAFVHAAFIRGQAGDEAYVGPVIRALRARLPADAVGVVALGPRTNFRVRRWRDRLREFVSPQPPDLAAVPVTAFAGWRALAPSREVWQARAANYAALAGSRDLRDLSAVGGCDLWPLVAEELRGVADLQFPWSARAMDEAGAALDALAPGSVVTYAEAGGWGRALMLEARRRAIPSVALQHGFIYRHWLNYLHEPDEMAASAFNAADRGFPRPDCTLVFDHFTREHLERHGHFPPESLRVTGSPRLDAIVGSARAFDEGARSALRARLGAGPETPIAVVAAKFTQLGPSFPALVEAARERPEMRLVVKPHPAEGAEPYLAAARGVPNVVVAPPDADLGRLTAIATALVTANSTAAIEAMPLGVPALVVELPNNLSPFVEAGAMAGAAAPGEVGPALRAVLYDREMRQRLGAAQQAFLRRYGVEADGRAAERAADAILSFART